MSKLAKILYPLIALLILAAPISAAADNQNLLWEKTSSLSGLILKVSADADRPFYEKLSWAIARYTTSFDFRIIKKKEPASANYTVKAIRKIIATAYSSTPDQTDASPFITANGQFVREGVLAANFLKFGTKVRIPEVFGDKIFVVADRMAKRNSHKIDIWMESRDQALQFGARKLNIEILN